MNSVSVSGLGKRFNNRWLFRKLSHTFCQDGHTVVLGANGSGKSTLLQVILGSIVPSEGSVTYSCAGRHYAPEDAGCLFSIATPYLELIEEYTLREMIAFQGRLRPYRHGSSTEVLIERIGLEAAADRAIRHYSSGMRQRVKLGLALLSDTPYVLLDEPTSNLDKEAVEWYAQLVSEHSDGRVVIVCSNTQEPDYFFCTERLTVSDFC
jgi:ABC-type multidrug transport system ATPase subunit